MRNLLLVGLGGCAGSMLRYLAAGLAQRLSGSLWFPAGTLCVNIAGSLAIGVLAGLAEHRALLTPATRMLVLVGLLGGFTTFSTFSYETLALLREGQMMAAGVYVGAHLVCGLGAVWLGYALSAAI